MAHAFTWQCTFTCFYHCLGRSLPVPTSFTSGQDLPPNKPIFTFRILTVTWEATSCCAWLNYFGGPTGLFFSSQVERWKMEWIHLVFSTFFNSKLIYVWLVVIDKEEKCGTVREDWLFLLFRNRLWCRLVSRQLRFNYCWSGLWNVGLALRHAPYRSPNE